MAIGFVVLFLKTLGQNLETISTGEVVRMELSKHGCGAFSNDWFPAYGTQGTTPGMVVNLTIGRSFNVEEFAVGEGAMAIGANKTIWMPLGTQSRYVICCYW